MITSELCNVFQGVSRRSSAPAASMKAAKSTSIDFTATVAYQAVLTNSIIPYNSRTKCV